MYFDLNLQSFRNYIEVLIQFEKVNYKNDCIIKSFDIINSKWKHVAQVHVFVHEVVQIEPLRYLGLTRRNNGPTRQ